LASTAVRNGDDDGARHGVDLSEENKEDGSLFFSASYRIGTESWVGFDFGLGLVGGLLLGCSTAR
jgi:hypothetical protein